MTENQTKVKYDLGGGFWAERVTSTVMELDDGVTIDDKATWNLSKDGDIVATKTDNHEYFDFRCNTFDIFREDIVKEIGNGYADWLRKQLSEEPGDMAPWERNFMYARKFQRGTYTCDDDGNANRFEDECRGWLVFDRISETWYAWELNHWTPAGERLMQAARFVGRSVEREEKFWEVEDQHGKTTLSKEYLEHKKRSANLNSQRAMVTMATANMSIDISTQSNMDLLACKNGIIDCRKGEFYPIWDCDQFKNQYPTAYVDCEYTPGAKPHAWLQHLLTVMEDNSTENLDETERENRKYKLTKYLIRVFGYILYPGNPERIFVFFWGRGKNGKSTTTSILLNILGTQGANPTLSQLYAADSDRPTPSIVTAIPKRMAVFSEADGDAFVSSSAFKELTGEASTERFRKMHADNVRVPIYCLPIGATNDIPRFDKPVDQALLNRLITIPFRHIFPEESRDISQNLFVERDGIFSLMVDELKEYLKDGLLEVPDCARATQQELLVGEDMYRYFTTAVEPTSGRNAEERMTRAELKEHFISWASAQGAEIDMRMVKDEGENSYRKILTKRETNRFLAAVKIMGYDEVKIMGIRYVKCRPASSPQKRLIP